MGGSGDKSTDYYQGYDNGEYGMDCVEDSCKTENVSYQFKPGQVDARFGQYELSETKVVLSE